MVQQELAWLRQAEESRRRQVHSAEEVLALAKRWPETSALMTDDERWEFVNLTVKDVTITPDDEVAVTGTLISDFRCTEEVFGSPDRCLSAC